jgi:NAD(P)-dependent dehydrogenase (short-subunit alcohol dehydrogenase family)
MPLDGQTAIVTGAGSGLGHAIALQLACEGADVAAVDINADPARATAAEIEALGRRALTLPVDVAVYDEVQAATAAVHAAWGRIDILIACAGISLRAPIVEFPEADWDRMLAVHLKGTFFCCQAVLPTMMEQRYGRIVTTASGQAVSAPPLGAAYAAAKGGIISFTRVLAREVEPYGITANAFGPGTTDTPMLRRGKRLEQLEALHRQAPFGRMATPEQGAELAVWFVRPETAHITGRVFTQNSA